MVVMYPGLSRLRAPNPGLKLAKRLRRWMSNHSVFIAQPTRLNFIFPKLTPTTWFPETSKPTTLPRPG